MAATIGLFGTGIALLFVGPFDGGLWRRLHILFFVGWFGLMTIHVLTYLLKAPELALADLRQQVMRRVAGLTGGAMTREGLLVGSVVLGLVLAIAFMSTDASWTHWATRLHD